jgi:hypothetical protein
MLRPFGNERDLVFVDIDSLATEAFTETNKTRRLRPVFTT